ncbi:hypothetical protein SCUP515_00089 [Seiridium cupressi]
MMAFRKFLTLGIASIAFLVAEGSPISSSCSETNLIQDPSFEGPKTPWINFHGALANGNSELKARNLNNYYVANLVTTDTFISVRQTVTDLTIGQSYALRFWYGLGTNQQFKGDICILSATIDGSVVGKEINLLPSPVGRYQLAERTFVADATSKVVRLEFNCGSTIGEVDALLDNISLVATCP